jgi:DHA1 family bicyclomycin/chloramphenicol resistance-like MFS transporter
MSSTRGLTEDRAAAAASKPTKESRPGAREFVALTASMMAVYAVLIDGAMPALAAIAVGLGVEHANQAPYIISAFILGMALGQTFYGPLSDSIGRKPSIYLGLAVCAVGCVISIASTTFAAMLIGRFFQGLGAAAPRTVTIALIRDGHEGAAMGRVMSFVLAVFVILPILASIVAQGILLIADWRFIFAALFAWDLAIFAWLALRQPETLPRARRKPFSLRPLALAVRETFASRAALRYTLAGSFILGGWFGYVNSARQIFQDIYGVGAGFPFYYSVATLAFGAMSLGNARLLRHVDMRTLCRRATVVAAVLSGTFFIVTYAAAGCPPLWATTVFIAALFACFGTLIGNFTSLAMAPLGHIAGVAAGVVSSLTWLLALILGAIVGQSFDGTLLPLVAGFTVLSVAALAVGK